MDSFLPKIQNQQNSFVEIKCVTWAKDSHGLFDYESKQISVKKTQIYNPSQILRNKKDQEIKITGLENEIDQNLELSDDNQQLTQIIKAVNIYYIKPQIFMNETNPYGDNLKNIIDKQEQEAFLIARSLKNKEGIQKGYQLKMNDIVKLGRIEYQIVEMKNSDGFYGLTEQFTPKEKRIYNIDCSKEQLRTCKICLLEEEQSEENPFISPCSCKGSCEYVHFYCLKIWVQSKINKKIGKTTTYKWKKLECELCQNPLPKIVKINNQSFNLIDLERPYDSNYIILESIQRDKKYSRGLIVIKEGDDEDETLGKMGRGHQCDIRISDISVSRFHAYFKCKNGKFYLFDNNSKFGTLIKLVDQFEITQDKMAIQIGRTVVTFINKFQNNDNSNKYSNQNTYQLQSQIMNTNENLQSQLQLQGQPQQQLNTQQSSISPYEYNTTQSQSQTYKLPYDLSTVGSNYSRRTSNNRQNYN